MGRFREALVLRAEELALLGDTSEAIKESHALDILVLVRCRLGMANRSYHVVAKQLYEWKLIVL